eukprot:Nitzschia sp. Nitz4//scaffold28_size193895//37783//38970//NITZ4_001633-RA/size193895-processed-gene-0.251-mRNA-1//-1//CDS//3329545886//8122//frame0
MIGAPHQISPDDISIPCLIRTSKESEWQHVTCIMQIWRRPPSPSLEPQAMTRTMSDALDATMRRSNQQQEQKQQKPTGPRLLFIPNLTTCGRTACADPIDFSERFVSFQGDMCSSLRSSSRSRTSRPRARMASVDSHQAMFESQQTLVILDDILVVDMSGMGNMHRCDLKTNQGSLDIQLENRNGQDILLAFLSANLPKDRMMGPLHRARSEVSARSVTSENSKTYDVETFTASRMEERLKGETLGEKLRRKVGRVFSSLEENFSTCGCPTQGGAVAPETRDSPPKGDPHDSLEMAATEDKWTPLKNDAETPSRHRKYLRQLPSGLSVEEDPDTMSRSVLST